MAETFLMLFSRECNKPHQNALVPLRSSQEKEKQEEQHDLLSSIGYPNSDLFQLNQGLNKYHTCQYCLKNFSSSTSLKCHIRIHTGEKPYSCTFCPYSSISKSNVKKHIRIHTGEKPFLCPHCNYRTSDKSHLNTHILIHR
ncbi:unnamed protein product [Meganyctiphanes norvegica]|uniref:C2H2-type domain-containing protein n=1 Tax=Meganyctiphanes norvegica TaxID=48144 RepID=A0AAV2SC19_MEGNR